VALALPNDFIAREELDCFAVFSYAIIDPEDRTLRVATAGFRPSGILRRGSDTFDMIESPGLGLGIVEGADYESVQVSLAARDVGVLPSVGGGKALHRGGRGFCPGMSLGPGWAWSFWEAQTVGSQSATWPTDAWKV